MESYEDDDLALPVFEKASSPIPRSKLKRLKRATSPSIPLSPPSLPLADPLVMNAPSIQIPSVAPHPAEIRTSSFDAMDGETFVDEIEPKADLDPLFSYPRVDESCDALCMSPREGNEVGSRQDEGTVSVEEPRKKKNVKRRLGLEEEEGDANKRNKKKERSRKISSRDGTVREKRKLEKARKAELEFLHAESQRLLRETRDASFKPLLIVQKPISSVLEKIRLRKLEMLKSCSILNWSDSVDDADSPAWNSVCSSEPARSKIDLKENDENPKFDYSVGNVDVADHSQGEIPSNSEDRRDSQLSTGDDILSNSHEAIPLSHPTASSFMVDQIVDLDSVASHGHDNNSSSGESDKENIRPRACNPRGMDSSPKDDLAKAFLDDEAEEEDDSDCDHLRFHENEDEDENETDEHENLDDIIATGYEDAPIDQEKRNELHQKWLEQQDAAETNNVIQRLKSGQGRGDTLFLHGGYDNYDGGEDDDKDVNDISDDDGYATECDDPTADKHHLTETTRQSLKKAKQMITQMFTDANDAYIPSDDEETEKDLIRRYILKQNEEPSFVSPVENENSREVFGLIKKLNIAPGPKKSGKGPASSVFDSLVASGSSNSSSKPSFVKRAGNSLPSSNKQGSTAVRAFVFSRDDSNSRSNISASETTTDTAPKESRPGESAMTDKFSSSKLESSIMEAKVHTKTDSGLSLFNILRQTSLQFDDKSEKSSSVGSQAAYHFSAFKVRKTNTNSRI